MPQRQALALARRLGWAALQPVRSVVAKEHGEAALYPMARRLFPLPAVAAFKPGEQQDEADTVQDRT